jgi:ABC-type arginine/histidine transport system permease subunit
MIFVQTIHAGQNFKFVAALSTRHLDLFFEARIVFALDYFRAMRSPAFIVAVFLGIQLRLARVNQLRFPAWRIGALDLDLTASPIPVAFLLVPTPTTNYSAIVQIPGLYDFLSAAFTRTFP